MCLSVAFAKSLINLSKFTNKLERRRASANPTKIKRKIVDQRRQKQALEGGRTVGNLVRPTGIEPVLRASETRILSVGRRSLVRITAGRYCSRLRQNMHVQYALICISRPRFSTRTKQKPVLSLMYTRHLVKKKLSSDAIFSVFCAFPPHLNRL